MVVAEHGHLTDDEKVDEGQCIEGDVVSNKLKSIVLKAVATKPQI